jgi:hypothetical protein
MKIKPKKKSGKRIADTHVTWKRTWGILEKREQRADRKKQVYDTVIRTKLMCRLESLQPHQEQRAGLDLFQ